MGLEPVSAISGGLQALVGAGQAIFGNKKRKSTEADLTNYANQFQPNQSILDYYNKSLAKYNTDPTQTGTYKVQQNQIGANTANAIGATQDRRGGLASIGKIMGGANRATGQNLIQAEAQQQQNLNRLGQAAGMKTNEEQKKFDLLYNLKAMKAGQAASTVNQGIRNLYGGLSTIATGADYTPKEKATKTPQYF